MLLIGIQKTISTMMMMTIPKTFDGDHDDDEEEDDDADTWADVALPRGIQVCSSSPDGRTHHKA